MANDRPLPSITESEAMEDMDIEENDEVHDNSCTSSSDRDENSDANNGEEGIGVKRGTHIDNVENPVQLEQVKQRIIVISTGLELVAGYYAYRGIRSRKLGWRGKAIQFFPMFIIPAAAYFSYSLFCHFTSTLKLKDSRSLERLKRESEAQRQKLKPRANCNKARSDIQGPAMVADKWDPQLKKHHGESSSMTSFLGSKVPEVPQITDEIVNTSPAQGINQLPPNCISLVISFTTPRDACVCSVVSRYFRAAADTDSTWECFLPSDYTTILARAVNPVEFTSMKELYLRLCDHPVVTDDGSMSFGLDKSSGAKCIMLSAKALYIVSGDDSQYWRLVDTDLSDSRFPEVAKLIGACWLEIHGRMDSAVLTQCTAYGAYLIFELAIDRRGLGVALQETLISIGGLAVCQRLVCLDPAERQRGSYDWHVEPEAIVETEEEVNVPTERRDGSMEIELGEFSTGDGFNGNVDVSFKEIRGNHWKSGLIVHGIEIRPKH